MIPDLLPERIARRIVIDDNDCWVWTGSTTENGYGKSAHRAPHSGSMLVHRLTYETLVGPVPDGHQIDHLCHVRECANPAHMRPATPAQNVGRRRPNGSAEQYRRPVRPVHPSEIEISRADAYSRIPAGVLALNAHGVAEVMACDVKVVRRAIASGALTAHYPTARPLMLLADVRAWIDSLTDERRSS